MFQLTSFVRNIMKRKNGHHWKLYRNTRVCSLKVETVHVAVNLCAP